MKAIVLSGGGSKGSYQIGAWKALRKLKINYDIVTGTSVGALNGALMVQKKYFKSRNLWKKITMNALFGDEISTPKNNKELLKLYSNNFLKHGGMDVSKLQAIIDSCVDKDKFYHSNIDFGLVTVNISNKKAIQLKKENIPSEKLCDYLMASASCYPAFKLKNIDGKKYMDGGMFDNLPINLALDLGADDIIAIDLSAPGFKHRPKKKVNIIKIKPNNKLSNFLDFNPEGIQRNMKLGYNDTLKTFHKLYGKKYSFKTKKFDHAFLEYKGIFIYHINRIINHKELTQKFKLDKFNIDKFLLKTCEQLGIDFKFDETKIYHYRKFNKKILHKANRLRKKNPNINKTIFLYNKLINKDFNYIKLKGLLNPKDLMKALYLYTLSEV